MKFQCITLSIDLILFNLNKYSYDLPSSLLNVYVIYNSYAHYYNVLIKFACYSVKYIKQAISFVTEYFLSKSFSIGLSFLLTINKNNFRHDLNERHYYYIHFWHFSEFNSQDFHMVCIECNANYLNCIITSYNSILFIMYINFCSKPEICKHF